MSTEFTIPNDPDKADQLATELGELATATEWKRAAIVYARVRVQDSQGRPPQEKVKTDLLSPAEYALRGIHGLRSKTTVRAYWRAWDNAITEGAAEPVSLGDTLKLPDAEWADYYHVSDQTTPPYYVPPPSKPDAVQLPVEPLDDDSELGECPPVASDIDRLERELDEGESDDTEDELDDDATEYYAKLALAELHSLKRSAERTLEWAKVGEALISRKRAREHIDGIRTVLDRIADLIAGD